VTIRIRTTEQHPHPIWERLVSDFSVAEIQGFIFSCKDDELITATRKSDGAISIQCLEAAEYDSEEEFVPENFFSVNDWISKVSAAAFFKSTLLFLTHKTNDDALFRLHKVVVKDKKIIFDNLTQFKNELSFINWWQSVKKLSQTKKTVEARLRQNLTLFDRIIEKYGYSWGGNMDGFIISDSDNLVKAIIEVRKSNYSTIEEYDPAKYFLGTKTKGGDFKTWLPLIYLKKAYNLPLILLTLSTKSKLEFGFTEVNTISTSRLFYVDDIPPTKNVTDNYEKFKDWIMKLTNR